MFREKGIEVLVFDARVDFTKKGNWFNTSWFCYKVCKNKLNFEEV